MKARMRAVLGVAIALVVLIGIAAVRHQLDVRQQRATRAAAARERAIRAAASPAEARRHDLYDLLQPVALANCRLQRFGEPHDGGYLMCANLLGDIQAGYSYGISGYDQWGCDVATTTGAPVHQYDCFDTTQPSCTTGRTIFHAECVGDTTASVDGRAFDSVLRQMQRNGDADRRVVMKMDVEGAEWPALLSMPDEVLGHVDQLVVEFHFRRDADGAWLEADLDRAVVARLRQHFEVGHLHFNNASCVDDLAPFPTWAYEVLFVNKRLAQVEPAGVVPLPHPLDAPNVPDRPDCLPMRR